MCLAVVTAVGVTVGGGFVLAGHQLLRIYSTDPEVIRYGFMRLTIICGTYFLCGWMDVLVGSLRGLGYSVFPMLVSLTGACGLRILWIFTIFQWQHTLFVLYLSYPVSWIITASAHLICFLLVRRRLPKKDSVSLAKAA